MSARKYFKSIILLLQNTFHLWPKQYCFVTGAPRTGTTAVVDWLSRQPEIATFNESRLSLAAFRFMQEVNRFGKLTEGSSFHTRQIRNHLFRSYGMDTLLISKKYLLDKEPLEPIALPDNNYEGYLQALKQIFPNLKIIYMLRDPLATIWSMSRRKWGHTLGNQRARYFTLEDHVTTWRKCAQLALTLQKQPNIYLCQFERLIENSSSESDQIFHFLGIRAKETFIPRNTKSIGFSADDRQKILQQTAPERLKLHKQLSISYHIGD